jgi:hypothetical protein
MFIYVRCGEVLQALTASARTKRRVPAKCSLYTPFAPAQRYERSIAGADPARGVAELCVMPRVVTRSHASFSRRTGHACTDL